MGPKPCIAVVSPFLDKRHGTERCVAEQAERLARDCGFEVHLFTQRVDDLAEVLDDRHWQRSQHSEGGFLVWHRVSDLPGPQLLKYLWWFAANHVSRWNVRRKGTRFDLVYTPGVNCFDADLISVHIVFAEFVRQVKGELKFHNNAAGSWPRLIHRRLYYFLLTFLERRIYGNMRIKLVAVSRKVADDIQTHCGRSDPLPVVYHGLDLNRFCPQRRVALRPASRSFLNLSSDHFVLLLVGNDFKKKGLRCALRAMAQLKSPRVRLLVVGEDDPAPYFNLMNSAGLRERVQFLPIRADVEFYYAAADLYVAPSLEDAFALPPFEAMACGVPAIVSRNAGVSEMISHGEDGLILKDPTDASALAQHIEALYHDDAARSAISERSWRKAQQYTWERNVAEMKRLIVETIEAREGLLQTGPNREQTT